MAVKFIVVKTYKCVRRESQAKPCLPTVSSSFFISPKAGLQKKDRLKTSDLSRQRRSKANAKSRPKKGASFFGSSPSGTFSSCS